MYLVISTHIKHHALGAQWKEIYLLSQLNSITLENWVLYTLFELKFCYSAQILMFLDILSHFEESQPPFSFSEETPCLRCTDVSFVQPLNKSVNECKKSFLSEMIETSLSGESKYPPLNQT